MDGDDVGGDGCSHGGDEFVYYKVLDAEPGVFSDPGALDVALSDGVATQRAGTLRYAAAESIVSRACYGGGGCGPVRRLGTIQYTVGHVPRPDLARFFEVAGYML